MNPSALSYEDFMALSPENRRKANPRWPYPPVFEERPMAYNEGRKACRDHPPRRDGVLWFRDLGLNPYNFETPEYEEWDRGYEEEADHV